MIGLTTPFEKGSNPSKFLKHANQWECFQIAQTFLDLGYQVDVINWSDETVPVRRDYSIFIDIHHNLERLSQYFDRTCIKVLHVTGSHWLFQNAAEYRRCLTLQARRGVTVVPQRQAPPSLGIETADCATMLGNKFTESTFRYVGKKIFKVFTNGKYL